MNEDTPEVPELEDGDDMDLGDLDLPSIATTCERKEPHSIPDQ
jgi:hypothetical protein